MNNSSLSLRPEGKTRAGILRLIGRFVAVLAGLYIILNILLYVFQEKLIFFPQAISDTACAQIHESYPNVEDICLQMQDGTRLRGWVVGSQPANTSQLLIYFGGNGDELSHMIGSFQQYPDWSVVLINYRGYGQSEGKPSEKQLLSDSLEIYDYFTARPEYKHAKIVVIGRSMGTGVAVNLAQNRPVEGVILASPYDSVVSVAQEKIPMVPVKFLLRNKFDSISRAHFISKPVLVITADKDEMIPPWHSQLLAKAFAGTVFVQEIAGADHDSLIQEDEYWQAVSHFLKQI